MWRSSPPGAGASRRAARATVGPTPRRGAPDENRRFCDAWDYDFLFGVQMTLYVDNPSLADAFRQPCYAVGIGRSQDLATYTNVAAVELHPASAGYLDNTLLPYEFRLCAGRGIVVTMPRFANRGAGVPPEFDHYVLLRERVYVHHGERPESLASVSDYAVAQLPDETPIWVDPQSEEREGDGHREADVPLAAPPAPSTRTRRPRGVARNASFSASRKPGASVLSP